MIKPEDIIIENWPHIPSGGMQTGKIPKGIKITHIETGITVTCDQHRSQHKNKEECLVMLEEELSWL